MIHTDRFRSCLVAAALFTLPALAQQYPLFLNTTVNPPYTASYVQYFQNPQQVSLLVHNDFPGATSHDIYLAGSIATLDGSISVTVEGGQPWNAPPLNVPVGFSSFNGADLQPFITNGGGHVQYTGISEEDIRLGVLPEGEYQVCLQAFDYHTNQPLSPGAPSDGCSNIFVITYPPPPQLLAPACEGEVEVQLPQTVLFNWILPSGPPIGASMQYRFKLVLLPEDDGSIDPLSALETSMDPVWEDDVMVPQVLYTQLMPALLIGRRYAWHVRAVDMNGNHTFQNNGWSEPCTFRWTMELAAWVDPDPVSGNFQLAYPAQQDTLPWDLMPVVVRFEPHALPDTTKQFGSKLDITRNGTVHSTTWRNGENDPILWNRGPYRSQKHLLDEALRTNFPLTVEEAHHINIYRNVVDPDRLFAHGSHYQGHANLMIAKKNGVQPIRGNVEVDFVSGMGRPRPLAPEHEAVLPAITDEPYDPVQLRFRTAEPPQDLLPPFPIYIIESGNVSQTQGSINERWILHVARDEAFTNVVHTADARLGAGLQLNNSNCDEGCLVNALYKEESVAFTPTENGTYYWRVAWLTSTDDLNGPTYHAGPIRQFSVGATGGEGGDDGTTTTTQEETIRKADCLAESRSEPVPVMERVAVNSTSVGDTVKVGLFKMRVTSISHAAAHYASGEGLIDVPVMDAALRVRFNNVRINEKKRLFDGVVNALYDNEGVIPPAWINGTSMAAGFSPDAARVLDEYLNTSGRLVSQLHGLQPMGLPLGVDKELPGFGRAVIGILGMQFTDTIARMNAGMALPVHELGVTLSLGNMSMPFHPGGFGDLREEATLYMISDVDIGIGGDTLKIKGTRFQDGFATVQDSGTFVAWDCQGFRAVTFDAEYRFDRETLREDLANGEDGPRKVIGALRVRTGRGGLMGRMDMNVPFHLTHARNWGFAVQEAWLDVASYINPPDMQLPERHFLASDHMQEDGTVDPTWTGVYVKRTMLRLPPVIERIQGSGRTTAQVDDFIYEFGEGVSASFKLANILDTDEGKLDGWAISLDTLQFDIVMNHFSQGGFNGRMRLPFSDTLLLYSGMIQHSPTTHDTRFEFLLHPEGPLNVPMYVGTMQLFETSTVRALLGDATTGNSARADLNGELSIDITTPFNINFRDIAFQGLYFQTDSPYTNIDDRTVYSLASPQKYMGGGTISEDDDDDDEENKAGGFPISITRVTTERRNSEGGIMAGIGFDINLDLSGQTNIFVATTRIAVLGQLNTTEIHRWGHHDIELDSIGVRGETGAVKIHGGLRWYHDDPTYGNGINGRVDAWFCDDLVHVRAAAQFGTVSAMRYWYADAMATWAGGAGAAGPFTVYGFGGGAWYHMKRMTPLPTAAALTQSMIDEQDNEHFQPGITLSSIRFQPDANEYLGLQATVLFGDGAGGKTYNGDLTLGASFSATGGMSTVFLNGNVYMLRERPTGTETEIYAPIWGTANIQFDFPNDVFSANFTMHVKVAKKVGAGAAETEVEVLTGTGTNGLAGAANLYISPDTWHFHVGTPQTPIGLRFAGLFNSTSYFMVGKDLPNPMPPDSAAVLALMSRSGSFSWPSSVATANGIAFGARADMERNFDFHLLRMHMLAGVGFDLAFLRANEMQCTGTDAPGIAGYYATGQAYAYLAGNVSIHVDVWFAEGDFEIMKLAAAAMLQAGFADPSWLRGEVGGRYNILNGLIDGTFNFPFEAGTPCTNYGAGALAGLDPIEDIIPHDRDGIASGSEPVSVGVNPEVLLTIRLDHPFQLKEYRSNGSTYWRTFRLKMDSFELKKSGVTQAATLELATSKDQVMMIPSQFLEPKKVHTLHLKLRAEEWLEATTEPVPGSFPLRYTDIPAQWKTAINQGQPAVWDTTVTFKTGEGLKELSAEHLNYTYPFGGQRFLLQDECRNGIIECQKSAEDQPLFDESGVATNRERVYRVLFTPHSGGPSITSKASVWHTRDTTTTNPADLEGGGNNGAKTTITFAIPPLQNGRKYVVQFIARDTLVGGFAGQHVMDGLQPDLAGMSTAAVSSTSYQSGMVNVRRRRLTGYSVRHNEKLLYTYHFATSAHNTITAKAAALANNNTFVEANGQVPPKETLRPDFIGERFDVFDVLGYQFQDRSCADCNVKPLITLRDDHSDNWSTKYADKVLYDYYAEIKARHCSNLDLKRSITTSWGITVISDSPDTIGIPPVRTLIWRPGNPTMQPLTASETAPPPANGLAGGMTGDMQYQVSMEIGEGGPSADVRIDHRTSHWVRDDHYRLQTITADVLSRCGVLYGETPMADPLRSMVIAYQNTGYKRPYRGNYRVRFLFNPPPSCTYMADGPSDIPAMSSGVAVFNHPTGPLPPIQSAPTNAPASGGTQTAP